jgi:hypothetical protein
MKHELVKMSRHTQLFGIAEQGVHLLRVDGSVNLGIVGESTPGSVFTNTHLQKISLKKGSFFRRYQYPTVPSLPIRQSNSINMEISTGRYHLDT